MTKKKTKPKRLKLKHFNVFYTPIPYEAELVVKATSIERAEEMVRTFLGDTVESVRGGWEVLSDEELFKQYGIKRS